MQEHVEQMAIPVKDHKDNGKAIRIAIRTRFKVIDVANDGRNVILEVPYGASGSPIIHPLFADRFGLSEAEIEKCEVAVVRKIAIIED